MVPVFNKVSPGNPCNYRPISLMICIAWKVVEGGVKEALIDFLREHKIIDAIVNMVL